MVDTISLENQDVQSQEISLLPSGGTPTYNPDYVDTKAQRYELILGQDSPGIDVIRSDIVNGKQDVWDRSVAEKEKISDSNLRMGMAQDYLATRDPMVAPDLSEVLTFQNILDDDLHSKDSMDALNRQAAKMLVGIASQHEDSTLIQDGLEDDPNLTYDSLDRAEYSSQRALAAQEISEEINGRYNESGFLVRGSAWLRDFVPLLNSVAIGSLQEGLAGVSLGSILNGSTLQEQVANLYALPPAEFRAKLKETTDYLYDINPHVAQQFAASAINYSDDNSLTDSFFSVVDFASIIPASSLTKSVVGIKSLRAKAINGISKSAKNAPSEISKSAGEMGLHATANKAELLENAAKGDPTGLKVLEDLGDKAKSGPNPKISQKVEQRLPTSMSPGKNYAEQIDLSSAARNRQAQIFERYANDPLVRGILRVDTLEPQQIQQAIARIEDHKKDLFRSNANNVIDSIFVPAEEDLINNVNRMTFVFGKRDGTLFPTEKAAQSWINRYLKKDTNDGAVVPHGTGGYAVTVTKPIPETGFRDMEIVTSLKSPDLVAEGLMKRVVSPDYQLAVPQVQARGRVAHSTEYMANVFKEASKDLQGLSKDSHDGLNRVWENGRVDRRYYKTESEFSEKFLSLNKRVPSQKEINANKKYVEINDLDWFLRNADIKTQMERKGLENISLRVDNLPDGAKSLDFKGTVVNQIPWNSKDRFVVRVITDGKPGKYFLPGESSAVKVNEIMKEGGYQIVRNDSTSTYYLSKEVKRSNIEDIVLPYHEGGHVDYAYNNFIKQAKVKVSDGNIHRYDGDISFASVPTESHARVISDLLEQGRKKILAKDPDAKKFFDDNLSEFLSMDEFMAKVKVGAIDLNQPFVSVRKGQSALNETNYQAGLEPGHVFISPQSSSHNSMATIGGRFIGQRDETILPVIMSEEARIVKTDYPALIRPSDVLASSIQNVIDLRVVNDLKWKSANDWIQEFGHLVDEDINRLRTNPEAYLSGNVRYRTGVSPDLQGKAERVRSAMSTMLNTPTSAELKFNLWKERILEKVSDTLGPNKVDLSDRAISTITHAPSFMKSLAFHSYLGLGNIKQLFVQGAEVYKIGLISPIQGARASSVLGQTMGALLTTNPQVLNRLSKMTLPVFGKPEDFLEMVDSFKRSGFSIVGHDLAFLDGVSRNVNMTSGVKSKVLDYGLTPFRAGELTSRSLAWGTSYLEWKKLNPGRKIDRRAETEIMQRAKNLTTNMGRDSASSWQRNPILSVPAQFLSYHARFMEQLWDGGFGSGRKLSQAEKARVVVGMGVAYGVPATLAGTGIPISKSLINKMLMDEGYEKDNVVINGLLDGLFTEATGVFTGEKLDLSASYGPSGPWAPLVDMINGDKSWVETLAGAGGGVTGQYAYSIAGSIGEAINMLTSEEGGWKVSEDILMEPLKNISSFNNAKKLWEVLNTQKYLTKDGKVLAESESTLAAISSYLLGVPLDRVSDAYDKLALTYGNKKALQEVQKEQAKYFRKATEAANRGDTASMKYYNDMAYDLRITNGLSAEQTQSAFKDALNNEPLTEKARDSFDKQRLEIQNRKN